MRKLPAIIMIVITSCSQPKTGKPITTIKAQQTRPCKYICIMDKDVCAGKPGVCPKCGMQLVEKQDGK